MTDEKVTRKLTTILAADVEGYTRLMRADEEATLKTLGEYREIIDGLIARHDGRVFSTGGDSVLAEFGSAVEAVRCAISVQEDIAIIAERLERGFLIRAHETRISLDIGGKDRGQLSRDFFVRHALTLPNSCGGHFSVLLTPSLLSCATSELGQKRKSSVGLGMSAVGVKRTSNSGRGRSAFSHKRSFGTRTAFAWPRLCA